MFIANGRREFSQVIAELHRQCFSVPWSAAEIADILCLPTTVGWVTENSFLLCSHVLDEMEILTIGVLPNERRKGRASELMQGLISYARNHQVRRIFLEVSTQNISAQKLYARFDFIQTGLRPGYYQTPAGKVDALCLTKEID